jgi:sRNA-binding regulator protein Hfq
VESVNEPDGRRPEREERIAPHEIELIRYRTAKTTLQFRLLTGELLEGKIRWYDHNAIQIVQEDKSEITVLRQAIAYYKTRS